MFSQNPREFFMDCILSRWQHPQIDHARLQVLDKDKVSKIPIPRNKNSALSAGGLEQVRVAGAPSRFLPQELRRVPTR